MLYPFHIHTPLSDHSFLNCPTLMMNKTVLQRFEFIILERWCRINKPLQQVITIKDVILDILFQEVLLVLLSIIKFANIDTDVYSPIYPATVNYI